METIDLFPHWHLKKHKVKKSRINNKNYRMMAPKTGFATAVIVAFVLVFNLFCLTGKFATQKQNNFNLVSPFFVITIS